MPYDVSGLRREEFPWAEEVVYLDHASIGPLPERTRRAVEEMNLHRSRPFDLGHEHLFGALDEARRAVASLIHAAPEEIALTTNTSFGLGIAARALPWRPGDVVLVSEREFPANVHPWRRLGERGVRCEMVPVTTQGWPDENRLAARLEDPAVRCLAISLVQFASGYVADLARLSTLTRRLGKFLVVDAIQAVGQRVVDVRETPVDVLACGGQKWLLSPWGSGFMYVRRELIPLLDPAVTGWMAFEGTDDFATLTDYRDALRPDARRFELVSLPFQDFVGMTESVRLLAGLDPAEIQAHLAAIQEPLLAWAARRGVPVTSPRGPRGSGIVSLALPAVGRAYRTLRTARVSCSLREGAIRLSPHCYNTMDEMERVAGLLDGEWNRGAPGGGEG